MKFRSFAILAVLMIPAVANAATQQEALQRLWDAEAAYNAANDAMNTTPPLLQKVVDVDTAMEAYEELGFFNSHQQIASDIDAEIVKAYEKHDDADFALMAAYASKYQAWFSYHAGNYTDAYDEATVSIADSLVCQQDISACLAAIAEAWRLIRIVVPIV